MRKNHLFHWKPFLSSLLLVPHLALGANPLNCTFGTSLDGMSLKDKRTRVFECEQRCEQIDDFTSTLSKELEISALAEKKVREEEAPWEEIVGQRIGRLKLALKVKDGKNYEHYKSLLGFNPASNVPAFNRFDTLFENFEKEREALEANLQKQESASEIEKNRATRKNVRLGKRDLSKAEERRRQEIFKIGRELDKGIRELSSSSGRVKRACKDYLKEISKEVKTERTEAMADGSLARAEQSLEAKLKFVGCKRYEIVNDKVVYPRGPDAQKIYPVNTVQPPYCEAKVKCNAVPTDEDGTQIIDSKSVPVYFTAKCLAHPSGDGNSKCPNLQVCVQFTETEGKPQNVKEIYEDNHYRNPKSQKAGAAK